jgi:hypothetical protein
MSTDPGHHCFNDYHFVAHGRSTAELAVPGKCAADLMDEQRSLSDGRDPSSPWKSQP